MAQRGIREYDAKRLFYQHVLKQEPRCVLVTPDTGIDELPARHPWLLKERLVVKPDQLFGKRGKNGLVFLDKGWEEARRIIAGRMNTEAVVGGVRGTLTHFVIEPFVPHTAEYYLALVAARDGDVVLFSENGGVDVEENGEQIRQITIPLIDAEPGKEIRRLVDRKELASFIEQAYAFFCQNHLCYLELNPFTVSGGSVVPLDMVAKIDDCAAGRDGLELPAPFGAHYTPEEAAIRELDEKTGASLKLTLLNPDGLVWPLVSGGGASVVFADTISDLGHGKEIAMYGEYSGDPSPEETYQYAKTVLDLMTRKKDRQGRRKVLLIGGGVANFTDVAKTFTGIIQALEEYADKMRQVGAMIYVRRGGPNYQAGLEQMTAAGRRLGLPVEVFGPELHMTRIVSIAMERAHGS